MDAQQLLAPAEQILGSWVGNFRILSFLLMRQDIKPLDWRGPWLPASGIFGEKNVKEQVRESARMCKQESCLCKEVKSPSPLKDLEN